jgi:hypothetical protein
MFPTITIMIFLFLHISSVLHRMRNFYSTKSYTMYHPTKNLFTKLNVLIVRNFFANNRCVNIWDSIPMREFLSVQCAWCLSRGYLTLRIMKITFIRELGRLMMRSFLCASCVGRSLRTSEFFFDYIDLKNYPKLVNV